MQIPVSIVMTFISLIYGLALTHALSCIAEYIQYKHKIKHYWVWWVWAIVVLFLSIGFWVSIYVTWSDIDIPMRGFVTIVLQAALFYLTIYIFFNHINEMDKPDLKYEYYIYKKLFFLLLFIQFFIIFKGFDMIKHNLSIYEMFMNTTLSTRFLEYILNPFTILASLIIIDNNKFHSIIAGLTIITIFVEFVIKG